MHTAFCVPPQHTEINTNSSAILHDNKKPSHYHRQQTKIKSFNVEIAPANLRGTFLAEQELNQTGREGSLEKTKGLLRVLSRQTKRIKYKTCNIEVSISTVTPSLIEKTVGTEANPKQYSIPAHWIASRPKCHKRPRKEPVGVRFEAGACGALVQNKRFKSIYTATHWELWKRKW